MQTDIIVASLYLIPFFHLIQGQECTPPIKNYSVRLISIHDHKPKNVSIIGDLSDDSNSDDDNNTTNKTGTTNEVTRVIENYGSCPRNANHHCLWYRLKVNRNRNDRKHPQRSLRGNFYGIKKKSPPSSKYLNKRACLLNEMRNHNHKLHEYFDQILRDMQNSNNLDAINPPQESRWMNREIAIRLGNLIFRRRKERMRKHRKSCNELTTHFMKDINQLLKSLCLKNKCYRKSMNDWIQMNHHQKEKLYRILLHAQRRDIQRLLQLRALKLWYAKRLHLLDMMSQRRLQRILAILKQDEHKFQEKLWERLEQLQTNSEDWAAHENAYKEALLAMGTQQKYLLGQYTEQNEKLDYLASLITQKVLPRQEQLVQVGLSNTEKLSLISRNRCNNRYGRGKSKLRPKTRTRLHEGSERKLALRAEGYQSDFGGSEQKSRLRGNSKLSRVRRLKKNSSCICNCGAYRRDIVANPKAQRQRRVKQIRANFLKTLRETCCKDPDNISSPNKTVKTMHSTNHKYMKKYNSLPGYKLVQDTLSKPLFEENDLSSNDQKDKDIVAKEGRFIQKAANNKRKETDKRVINCKTGNRKKDISVS